MIMNDEQKRLFLEGIRMGLDTESSASYANTPVGIVFNLLKRGKNEQERCFKNGKSLKIKQSEVKAFSFYSEFMKAKAELQIELLGAIKNSENFKAQQWLLERSNSSYQGSEGIMYLEEDANGFI